MIQGNRWIVSLWTATPKNQPALDYTELDPDYIPQNISYIPRPQHTEYTDIEVGEEDYPQPIEVPGEHFPMQKRESDI